MNQITNKLGSFEYEEKNVIEFKEKILGFEEFQKYVFVKYERDTIFEMLNILISIDDPNIVFPIFPIRLLVDDYPEREGYDPFGIVRLDPEPKNITINLKSPIYINFENNEALQVVLEKEEYPIEYSLFVSE